MNIPDTFHYRAGHSNQLTGMVGGLEGALEHGQKMSLLRDLWWIIADSAKK